MTARRRRLIVYTLSLMALGVAVVAHAQAPDGPTSIVMSPAPIRPSDFTASGSDFTWPAAAALGLWRFFAVLERVVDKGMTLADRVMGFADRWLDKTAGRFKVDFRKTIVSAGHVENDPDRTGEIPRLNRRRDDPGRNGAAHHDDDDEHQ